VCVNFNTKMKKFTSFAVVKQVAKEKMGKAESQVESPEAMATKDQLSTLKLGYKNMASSFKGYTNEGLPLAVSQGEIVAEAMLSFGGSLEGGQPLAELLKSVGLAQREIDNHLLYLCNNSKEKMFAPTHSLLETEIKRCTELKGKQETARLKYDAALTDLKTQQKKADAAKLQKAEEATQVCKQSYEETTNELTEATHRLQKRVEAEMTGQLQEYAEVQLAHFRKGLEVWENIVSQASMTTTVTPDKRSSSED